MKRMMENSNTGQRKMVKVGFSWTMFFFGALVPLFRGDLKWFAISFFMAFLTFGLSWLVMPFVYNGKYIDDLFSKGWRYVD